MSVVRTLIGNVKGPKGDTGSQGPQGVAGTIEIGSVQTVSYGSPASVTNSGTEEEAILDFQIPQGAPGAQVTDMSNLVLSTITDSTDDYPAFAVSETGSTIFGKIRKFLSDLKSKYVSKSMMSTSTNIGTPGEAVADAVAIKTLNDSIATLTALVTPSRKYFTNWNVTKWGHYCAVNWWNTGFTMDSDGVTVTGTIEQGYRPYNDVRILTKVYNGSAYVECVFAISTAGVITIRGIDGSKINGIQPRYLQLNSIVYYVD